MSKLETIVNGITEYTDRKFDVEILKGFSEKSNNKEAVSVADVINDEVDEFINEAGLELIFGLDDKEVQKKLLQKIMYITFLSGLGEDARTMMLKGLMKFIDKAKDM